MDKRIDLTEGKITSNLIKLSIPIMATSFIQVAYNMADMIWVGRIVMQWQLLEQQDSFLGLVWPL